MLPVVRNTVKTRIKLPTTHARLKAQFRLEAERALHLGRSDHGDKVITVAASVQERFYTVRNDLGYHT